MQFRHHLVVRARCAKRWRGANFDLAAAQGNVGAAVARALGLSARGDLASFLERAVVKAYGEGLPANPAEEIDPAAGEAFEFHVGLRVDVDAATLARVERAVREAVASSRHFALA
jgi:hypothetical protein